jgi:DNA-binding transcriptional LysR family regulator
MAEKGKIAYTRRRPWGAVEERVGKGKANMPPRRKSRPVRGAHMTVMEPRLLTDWEAAHVFLEVARSGSFRAAAEKLRQSVNALRRKVDELEARMGFPLLMRRANGAVLTEEGAKVFEAAVQMEKASFDLVKAQDDAGADGEGEVTVAVTEGLGSVWLTSKLPEFQRANPNVMLNLSCAMRAVDVTRLEADIAIRLDRPKSSELKISKLGRLHIMFYAHRSYLDAHGTPASISDLSGHRLISQYDVLDTWVAAERYFFPNGTPKLSVRTNVGSANVSAILNGAGIGVLPTYVGAMHRDLVALDMAPSYPIDIWITYHADAKKSPRVRKAIEWLTQAFDPRRYSWFRDEFVHPRKFAKQSR